MDSNSIALRAICHRQLPNDTMLCNFLFIWIDRNALLATIQWPLVRIMTVVILSIAEARYSTLLQMRNLCVAELIFRQR